jgi:hypothetical protein
MAERTGFADALKRVTQDIPIDRSIRWKEARLPDTMGYRPRSRGMHQQSPGWGGAADLGRHIPMGRG